MFELWNEFKVLVSKDFASEKLAALGKSARVRGHLHLKSTSACYENISTYITKTVIDE
jgi:hypothetical protein